MRPGKPILMLLGLALLAPVASVLADEPLPSPTVWTACSPNGEFCARLDPARNVTAVYSAAEPEAVLWSMPGWFRVAALGDDGEHLVTGYDGLNLVPQGYDPDMVMLTFHRRGAVIATVRLGDLIGGTALARNRTVSNHYWGDYVGFDDNGYYVVRTAADREYRFDVTTGRMVR